MEDRATIGDSVSAELTAVELTPAEAKLIGQMRGEIPPDKHPLQEFIDEREGRIKAAGMAYDEARESIAAAAERATDTAKTEYDENVAQAHEAFKKAVERG